MTAHHNDWDTSAQQSESFSIITSSSDTKIAALKAEMAEINKNLIRVLQVNQQFKVVTPNYETCGGPHSFNDCPTTVGNPQNVYAAGAYQGNSYRPQGNRNLLSYHFDNYLGPQGFNQNQNQDNQNQNYRTKTRIKKTMILRGTTREGTNYSRELTKFMKMNTASSSGSGTLRGNTITNPKEDLKATKDMMHPTNNGSIEDVQPSVVQSKSLILNSEPVISPIIEPVASQVSSPRPNQRPSIPYPSRLQDQKLHDKANDQRDNFFQILKDLNFNISFADALILMPKFGPSIKILLTNKDKLCELARTPLNENCSTVLLKKLQEKLGDSGKFLIPCDFPIMAECLALADLGASINLTTLFVWNNLSLPDLSPTCMTLQLANHSISRPVGVAEDVFFKVGTFHFPADFIVVDFDADPRVPLILERSFLKTRRALIDVVEGELTLRVGKEAITFNLDQTSRYLANYNDMMPNRIDVIDMPLISFSKKLMHLAEVDQSYVDTEGDILLLEAFLNDDPSLPPPNQGNYLPEVRKELKICEAKSDKSSIDETPKVELKDLPPHLEYAFLEGDDKLPVIIVKDLSVEEKTALITVLNLHKRSVAWKLSDIKGIDPEFCTHKILMEEDFEPAVQHQRRANPKIYDVIKQEEKSHFMVKEGIVLGHKISKNGIEVDKAKVDVIAKLPHLTTVKGIQSFLGHVGFIKGSFKNSQNSPTDDPSP
nr:hypothetical protein [Tanacetum cinerariifolium]